MRRRSTGLVAALFAVVGGLLVGPATAGAACPSQTLSKPFAAFGDLAPYFPVANGGFEGGSAGWSLAGGASVVGGNETWQVGGAADSHALRLPIATGAVATSPLFCVTMATPTTRFFVRSDGFVTGSDWGYLSVEAQYSSRTGGANLGRFYLATVDRHDGAWTPTSPIALVVSGGLNGGMIADANVRLIFTAHGAGRGNLTIDDVAVDPIKCC